MEDFGDDIMSSLSPLIAVAAAVSVKTRLEAKDLVKLWLLSIIEVLYLRIIK